MVTPAQVRKLVLSLDDVEEGSHGDHADFRRGGKIFAGLTRDEQTLTLRLTPEVQGTLDGELFYPAAGAWGARGWTQVELARAELPVITALVREAWTLLGVPANEKNEKKGKKKEASSAKRAPTARAPSKKKGASRAR